MLFCFQVPSNYSSVSWTDLGLATSISSLVIKLSSPSLPSTMTIICTSIIGKDYQKEIAGSAKLDKPSSPVLGEPLMSSKSSRGWQGLCLIVVSCRVCFKVWFGLEHL